MKNNAIRKGLVVIIITLFIGASFVSAIDGNNSLTSKQNNDDVNESNNNTPEEENEILVDSTTNIGNNDIFEKNQKERVETMGGRSQPWEGFQVVSTMLDDSTNPSTAVADDLSIHVVWEEAGKIYYRSRSAGGTWSDVENVRVSAYQAQTPTISTYTDDMGDLTIHVAWAEWYAPGCNGPDIYYRYRDDDGWLTAVECIADSEFGSFTPTIDIDNTGKLHAAWSEETKVNGKWSRDIYYSNKDYRDVYWEPMEMVKSYEDRDYVNPDIVVNITGGIFIIFEWYDLPLGGDTLIHVMLRYIPAGFPMYSGGQTGIDIYEGHDPAIAVDEDGRLYVTYAESSSTIDDDPDSDIVFTRRDTNGYWYQHELVSGESYNSSWDPSIDVYNDGSGTSIHIAWQEHHSSTPSDIWYKNNTAITGWNSRPLEEVFTEGTGSSFFPCMAVDIINTPHVVWVDTSNYGGAGSDQDIFYKNKPSGGNFPPIADFHYDPEDPDTHDIIQFYDDSTDPNGDETIDEWYWEFGDGDANYLREPTHQYEEEAIYSVKLRVTDDEGLQDTITKDVPVGDYNSIVNVTNIKLIASSDPIMGGDTVEFEITIINDGTAPAHNFDINLYINDEPIKTISISSTLSPGHSKKYSYQHTFLEADQGFKIFKAAVDNEMTTTFRVYSEDALTPKGNIGIIEDLKIFFDEIVDFVDENWDEAKKLVNPFLSNKRRQEIQDGLAEKFPNINTLEESASVFQNFLKNVINDHSVVIFTPDADGGTKITIDGEYIETIDFELDTIGVDEIKIDASLSLCILTFSEDGEVIFEIELEIIFQIYPAIIPEFGIRAKISGLEIYDIQLSFEFIISFCPGMNGLPTLALFGELKAWTSFIELTLTFNDPASMRNAAASLGVYVGADVEGYAVVGGGISVEGGLYASVDFADCYDFITGYASDLDDCLETHGSDNPDGVVDMLEQGITVGACMMGSLPDSATVGVEFGVSGGVGLGLGGSAANAGAKASIDATGSLSAGISTPVNIFGTEILENKDDMSKFFEAVETQASIISDIYDSLDISTGGKSGRGKGDRGLGEWFEDQWEEYGKPFVDGLDELYDKITAPIYMIDAFMTALETAQDLKDNIPKSIRENVTMDVNLGIGVEGDAAAGPEIAAGVELGLGAETNLETVLAVYTLDVDTFLDNGYGAIFLSESMGLGVSLGPVSVQGGVGKDILKFAIQGKGGKSDEGDGGILQLPKCERATNVVVVRDYGNDTDFDGLNNSLSIDIQINAATSEEYVIAGFIYNDSTCFGFTPNKKVLSVGLNDVTINFDGLNLRNQGFNGSYEFGIMTGGTDATTAFVDFSLYNTSSYNYDGFEETSVELSQDISHNGILIDEDEEYDYLQVDIEIEASQSEQLYINGFLSAEDMIVTNETVIDAEIGTNTITLYFDGMEIRKGGYDSPYELSYKIYNSIGVKVLDSLHSITGYTADDFEKPPSCLSDVYSHTTIDDDGDDYDDYLVINVGVDIDEPGVYTLNGFLVGDEIRFTLSNTLYIAQDGTVPLVVDGDAIRESGKNHIFSVMHLVLSSEDTIYGSRFNPYNTTTIYANQFDEPAIYFKEIYNEQAVDENSNGLHDFLKIGVFLDVTEPGMFKLSGVLNCSEGFVYSQNYTYLGDGNQYVNLLFDGRTIRERANEYSETYTLEQLSLLKEGTYIDFIDQAYSTDPYDWNEFEIRNKMPTADFSYNPPDPEIGTTITFNGLLSSDPDGGDIDSWLWDFGDGVVGSGSGPTHAYSNAGSFTVKLTVTDDEGGHGTTTKVVVIPRPEIAGHWHLDEGTGSTAYDDTENNNDGTITGATWEENGTSGSCLDFDGVNDYVTVTHTSSLQITNHFSVEAWINASSEGIGSDVIVDKLNHAGANDDRGFTFNLNFDGKIELTVFSGASSTNAFGTSPLRDNNWHYVAGMWNGTHISVYVDGVKEGSVSCTSGPTATSQNMGIGRRLGGYIGYMDFKGYIDEVRIIHDNTLITLPPPDIVVVDDNFDDTVLGWNYWRFDAIQHGINAVDTGGTVAIANGTYYETLSISYKTVDLVGSGSMGTEPYSSIVDAQNLGTILEIDHSDYVNVTGLQFINSDIGIHLKHSNHNTIDYNTILGISYKVVEFIQSDHNDFSWNLFWLNDAQYGMRLSGSSYNTIDYNTINPTQNYGIYITQDSINNYINDNTVNGSISGITITQGSDINTIHDNNLWNSGSAIHVLSDGSTITDNNINGNTYGISLSSSNDNDISDNSVTSNSHTGICLDYYCSNNTIDQNTVGGDIYGIYLYRSSDNDITNNPSISGHDEGGIYLDSSSENLIDDNYASSALGYGICLDSSNENILIDNHVGGQNGIGLIENSCYNNVTGSWATAYYGCGIYIGSNSNNNNIGYGKFNWVYGSEYGIYITESSDNFVYANQVGDPSSSNQYGIYLDSCDKNNISTNHIEGNYYGLYITGSSSQNDIYHNQFALEDNNAVYGLYIDSCDNTNPIRNNSFFGNNEHGLMIDSSNSQSITDNNFALCGIHLHGDDVNHWNTHTIIGNNVSGNEIRYYKDESDMVANITDTGQIILANCDNITIKDFIRIGYYWYHKEIPILLGFSTNCNISNNTIKFYDHPIHLEHSQYNDINNNTIEYDEYNEYGIGLFESSENDIILNNIMSTSSTNPDFIIFNGILLDDNSIGNDIYENTIDTILNANGIHIGDCSDNTIYGNMIGPVPTTWGKCISLLGSTNNYIIANELYDNNYGIYLEDSHQQFISGNNVILNWAGIYLLNSYENQITTDNFVQSIEYGIWLHDSNYNTIDDNSVVSTPWIGIYLTGTSERNTIIQNTIESNGWPGGGFGIRIMDVSNENDIYHNVFIGNMNHAEDHCFNNWNHEYLWTGDKLYGGNYWDNYPVTPDQFHGSGQNILGSDGIGDNVGGITRPYLVLGPTSNFDDYPFVNRGNSRFLQTLYDAVDTTNLMWTTGGDADWFRQQDVYYYDEDAAQSGPIVVTNNSWIKTFVGGPGVLKFYWNVSSTAGQDFLTFYIDTVNQARISGNKNWAQKTYNITSGYHDLIWEFTMGSQPAYHLEEGFDGIAVWPPEGWEEISYAGSTGFWEQIEVGDPDRPGREPFGATGYYAVADSDYQQWEIFDVGLFSPSMDLSQTIEPVYLECGINFRHWETDFAEIRVHCDGEYFDTIAHWEETTDPLDFVQELDIASYPSTADVQLEFRYSTQQEPDQWFFSIDNVLVYEEGRGPKDAMNPGRSILDCGWLDNVTWTGNLPPYTPSNPDPSNGATDVNINANLSWTGGDPNPGDTVTYDVYFDTVSPPSQVVWGQTETAYDPGTLEYNTTYYWKIVAKDQLAATTEGPIWSFTTEEENLPPDLPYAPYPENDSIDVEILPTLQVTVDDPDGDELDVYWFSNCTDEWTLFDTNYSVDTSGGPVNVSQINDNFDKYGTTYWWSVNVTDTFAWANATFYFTTEGDTMLPSIEFIPPTPDNGTIQSEDYIEVNLSANDDNDLYAFVDFNSDLGFWMRMDDVDGSTVYDLSSYGNNGTAVNESHQVENGRYGKAFDFDGDGDYIEIPTTEGLDFAPDSFTISAWIKPRNVSSGWITILEHGRLLDNWFGIWIDGSLSKFHFRVGDDTTNSNEALLVDRWYHVVGVYNASNNSTLQYINGNFDSSEVITPGVYWDQPASQSMVIGAYGYLDDEYFDGIIDEILIFDRILNEEEIKALYSIKTLNQHEYYSKVYGNWLGQIAGNFLGRETEGDYISSPNPAESIYYSPYSSYITGTGDEHDYKNLSVNSQTDDDTSMEWVDLWMLENYGLDITYEEVNSSWQAHMTSGIFFANKYAYMLMTGDAEPQSGPCDSFYECTPTGLECPGCCGCIPPYSGMEGYNPYFDYIDAQIESEVFGVLSPGMIKSAEKWGDWFARVTNDGYAVDFAKFYSMMYAEAIFEDNITRIIETVTAKYLSDSKVVSVVENVTGWYHTYSDWRDTRSQIHSKYYTDEYLSEANGRGAWWIHSTHNFAATLMSLLYGNGDFDKAIQITALAGWDNDCNAATVGGLMGTMLGAENIPHKWRYPIRDFYENTNRNPTVLGDDTITNIANRTINLGALFIQENGGNSFERGGVIFYEIPTENYGSAYHKFTDLPDGTYRFTGYAVDRAGNRNETEEREVTIQINNPPNKPSTPSGPTLVPAGYKQVYNTSTTDPENHQIFYMWDWGDGNITGWIGPYPSGSVASANHTWTELGTYNVTVKAKDDLNGDGNPVDGLESPWSDPLLVYVVIPGDLDGDSDVDLSDLAQLLAHYGTIGDATYWMGDIDGDGDVDLSDLAALLANYGTGT